MNDVSIPATALEAIETNLKAIKTNSRPGFALCGAPGSGKTLVANHLVKHYGYQLIDDGLPLRKMVAYFYEPWGITFNDVITQEGKARKVSVNGRVFTVRELLGEVGNQFEHLHDDTILAERACREVLAGHNTALSNVVFASVRKTQGWTYKVYGGLVVEVRRPGCSSPYAFDTFDASAVDHVIHNDGSIDDLFAQVDRLMESL